MTYLQDLPLSHNPAQLDEAVQDAKTGRWQHEQPDTTSNFPLTGKPYSGEKLNFGYCFVRVSSSQRARQLINAHLGLGSVSFKRNVFKLICFRQKRHHSSHCHSFQSCLELHRKQRSRNERLQGDHVSGALEQESTLQWLLVSESPVMLQDTIKENLRQ